MLSLCYLRRGKAYLPTMGSVPRGPYRGIEPVAVAAVMDTTGLRQALRETLLRGNPIVPDLLRADQPPPVILKYAGVKTWNAFARDAVTWQIDERDGVFRINPTKPGRYGGLVVDRDAVITLSPGSTIDDLVDRMIVVLQGAARGGAAPEA